MERMLVAIFDGEEKAQDGFRALRKLEEDGSIGVYVSRVVVKHDDGAITVSRTQDPLPQATLGGTALGNFLGLLGGPVGVVLGTATGLALGAAADYTRARVGRDFVAEVASALVPGKAAMVAEIDEESTGVAGARMEALGGSVSSRDLLAVEDWDYEREVTALRARAARADAAFQAGRAERKARLKARTDALNEKLHRTLARSKG